MSAQRDTRDAGRITGIVLAAGAARRFGAAKLVAAVHGRPIITHVVDAVLAAGLACIVVVDAADPGPVRDALEGRTVTLVKNEQATTGLASSIRAGIGQVPAETQAVILLLGDQPTLGAGLLRRLVDQWRTGDSRIVVPEFRGQRGPPALFSRSTFPELVQLEGDEGARRVVDRDPGRVSICAIDAPMPPDIDTPADLDAMERAAPERSSSGDRQ